MSGDSVMFALADGDPLGKCSAEAKVSLPESIDEQLAFLATAHGMTKSAYIREICIEHCLGRVSVVRMRVQRPLRSAS